MGIGTGIKGTFAIPSFVGLDPILETQRLSLHLASGVANTNLPANFSDQIRQTLTNEEVYRNIGAPFANNELITLQISNWDRQYNTYGHSPYIVTPKGSDIIVGIVGLEQIYSYNSFDFGWRFLPEFQKQGLALEASAKILSHIEERRPDIGKVEHYFVSDRNNPAAYALAAKLGAISDGLGRIEINGHDYFLMITELKNNPTLRSVIKSYAPSPPINNTSFSKPDFTN